MAEARHYKGERLSTADRERLFRIFARLRTFTGTAREFGCSPTTVRRYHGRYDWARRLRRIDKAVQARSEEREIDSTTRDLESLERATRAILHGLEAAPHWSRDRSVRALADAVKAKQLLRGEPTERIEGSLVEHLRERYLDNLRRKAQEAKALKRYKAEYERERRRRGRSAGRKDKTEKAASGRGKEDEGA